jgi:hypothetical protein
METSVWDCQLVLGNAGGEEGPVFKAFATIQPRMSTIVMDARHRSPCGGPMMSGIGR